MQFFCSGLCISSLFLLWLASPDGTPLEEMDKFSGKVIYTGYSTKNGVGTLKLEQINGDVKHFEIDKTDEKIYNGKGLSPDISRCENRNSGVQWN